MASKKNVSKEKTSLGVQGLGDILPEKQGYYDKVLRQIDKLATRFGYKKIGLPVIEKSEVFLKTYGKSDGFDEDKLVIFKPKGRTKKAMVLRADLSVSIARAFITNNLNRWPKPIRLYSHGPIYFTNPKVKGEYYQENQAAFEIFGRRDPLIDVQVIQFASLILSNLGITENVKLRINNLGCKTCRKPYLRTLNSFFKQRTSQICKECKKRLRKNPFLLFECTNKDCVSVVKKAPHIINSLCEDCDKDFKRMIKFLNDLEIDYEIHSLLVNNLSYVNKVFFSFDIFKQNGEVVNFVRGSRKDNLLESIGTSKLSCLSFNLNLDAVIKEVMELEKKEKEESGKVCIASNGKVFVIGLGDMGKKEGLKLYLDLLNCGIDVVESFGRESIQAQLKKAEKSKARFSLIIGQKEAIEEMVIVRDMQLGSQETMLKKRLIEKISELLNMN